MTRSNPWIVFEPLFDGVVPPAPSTAEAAGLDAVAYLANRTLNVYSGTKWLAFGELDGFPLDDQGLTLWEGWRAAIPLGFKARLPEGYEMQVRSRSGLALKQGLIVLNAPGTIDSDYPGEWAVILANTSKDPVTIKHGDRIAQLVLAPVYRLEWKEGQVAPVGDRTGGFGSTGV